METSSITANFRIEKAATVPSFVETVLIAISERKNMKTILGIVMVGTFISGCALVENCVREDRFVADAQECSDTQKTSAEEMCAEPSGMPTFEDGVLNSYHPIRGERFRNTGREELRVIQVLSDKNREGEGLKYVIAVDYRFVGSGMTFWIESPRDYVDGELIADGVYEFVGTHNYETLDKSHKTVRVFREVTDFKAK